MPGDGTLKWRMALWVALVASLTYSIAVPTDEGVLLTVGGNSIYTYDLLVAAAFVLGATLLLRWAGESRPSFTRLASRIIIWYLLYQLLVVIPVAVWIGGTDTVTIVRAVFIRFDWLLFPALLPLFRDAGMRKMASRVLIGAAAALAVWGVYLALTGGGGYYSEAGEGIRYRIMGALALPVFAWPLAVAVSDAVPAVGSLALGGLALVGQTLTGFRSGLVALGVAALAGLGASKRLWRVAVWMIPAGLIAVVVYLLWGQNIAGAYGYILSHLFDMGSPTGVDRLTRWDLAAEYIRANPFTDYVWSWHRYLLNLTRGYEPHNFVLEIGTTEGVAGLVFYGAILSAAVLAAWKRGWADAETRALACFLLAYLTFSAGNANWYAYSSMPLLVAVVAALAARTDQLRHGD